MLKEIFQDEKKIIADNDFYIAEGMQNTDSGVKYINCFYNL